MRKRLLIKLFVAMTSMYRITITVNNGFKGKLFKRGLSHTADNPHQVYDRYIVGSIPSTVVFIDLILVLELAMILKLLSWECYCLSI